MRIRALLLVSGACVVAAFTACDSDQQVYDDTLIDWDGAFPPPDASDGSGGTSGTAGGAGTLNLGGFSGTGGMAGEAGGA